MYLGRALAFANEPEQARHAFQRQETGVQKISTQGWEELAIFALDSLLDIDPPDTREITQQRRRLQESGACLPLLLVARLLLRDSQPDQALVVLEEVLEELKGRPSYDIVRIEALRALAFMAKGDEKRSLVALQQVIRVHLFSALGALKIGMDILFEQEQVKIDQVLGHGGFFKTEGVGQKIMAAAMNVPVTVMETAGEGGAWGAALLASYMLQRETNESLEAYLSNKVFAGEEGPTIAPDQRDIDGFDGIHGTL